ncbi:trypsin-like peptidase domain-containing protein [Pedobacter sp.]|uniref:trypsin-like peptidase domain-containing protein n=1 Tax=Pedobacter sp. TaxID=1411316 RepID=UPI003BAAD0EB
MMWDKKLTQLRDALSLILPFQNAAFNMVRSAGINTSVIDFEGGSLTMWTNILHYAMVNREVNKLVDSLLEHFPNNPHLLTFREESVQDYNPGPDIKALNWKAQLNPAEREKIMKNVNTLLPIRFLTTGIKAAKAVARVRVETDKGSHLGSGFLIKGNLFITNNHVIANEIMAKNATIDFDYEEQEDGSVLAPRVFKLMPELYFRTSLNEDWTVVAIDEEANAQYGALKLKNTKTEKGNYVNIVQHPAGRHKQIALYHNIVTYADESIVQYLTDTEPGSSGAPVFDSNWEVVAIHQSGGLLTEPGTDGTMLRNQGIAIGKIINAIQD